MDSPADHVFNRKWAAPALVRAMDDLAVISGRDSATFDGMRLGDAYALAVARYGDQLPEFWRVWSDWNQMPDTPAAMGDL